MERDRAEKNLLFIVGETIEKLGFVKPIRNGLRKIQNSIQSRSSKAETELARRENGVKL